MNVKIYSTPTCSFCHMAKDYFKANNVSYTDVDVSIDTAQAQEMIEKTGQMGVPVIIIEKDGTENIVIGFDKEKLASLLGL
jgi:glutaredoxin-like YruB-family protein